MLSRREAWTHVSQDAAGGCAHCYAVHLTQMMLVLV